MTARADAGRRRMAVRLGAAAGLMALLAAAAVALDLAGRRTETIEGPVVPGWAQQSPFTREIRVTTRDETLTLAREGGVWLLRERNDHEASLRTLAELDRALGEMRFAGARTEDPRNHARLGVTDPEEGGEGVRLTIVGQDADTPLVDLIVGAAREDGFFVRRPDEEQTYAVLGDLPRIGAPDAWLDLDVLGVERAEIREVEIAPEGGGVIYRLTRGSRNATDFVLAEPREGWELITAGAANGPGGAIAELRFRDVRPRSAFTGAPVARHTVRTFGGLRVELALFADGEARWAAVMARAEDSTANLAAQMLTTRTEGWVYLLPEYAADRLARPLDRIAQTTSEPDTP